MSKIKDCVNKIWQWLIDFKNRHPFLLFWIECLFALAFFGLALASTKLWGDSIDYFELEGFQYGFNTCGGFVLSFIFVNICVDFIEVAIKTISPHIRKWLKIEKRKEKGDCINETNEKN